MSSNNEQPRKEFETLLTVMRVRDGALLTATVVTMNNEKRSIDLSHESTWTNYLDVTLLEPALFLEQFPNLAQALILELVPKMDEVERATVDYHDIELSTPQSENEECP